MNYTLVQIANRGLLKALKVKNHMRASDAVNPRIRIVKAARKMGKLNEPENTDGA